MCQKICAHDTIGSHVDIMVAQDVEVTSERNDHHSNLSTEYGTLFQERVCRVINTLFGNSITPLTTHIKGKQAINSILDCRIYTPHSINVPTRPYQ